MALSSSIINVVRSALLDFTSAIETRHSMKIEDRFWSSLPMATRPLCSTILQSGKNKGRECGKTCTSGKNTCASHSKSGIKNETSVGAAPVPPLKGKAVFHKSKFGNFVCDGFVFDRVSKGVAGKEDSEGKIIPLTVDEETKVRALGLKVTENGTKPVKASEVTMTNTEENKEVVRKLPPQESTKTQFDESDGLKVQAKKFQEALCATAQPPTKQRVLDNSRAMLAKFGMALEKREGEENREEADSGMISL